LLARQFALLGVTRTVRMALPLLDKALWDAIAQMHRVPLATLLGGRPQALSAYDSRGLGLMEQDRLKVETSALLELGLKAVKLRLGYPSVTEDIAAIEAVRSVVGDDVAIMVDYNQALTVVEAFARGRDLDRMGVYWLEEPIMHDDYASYAALAHELRVPVQIGENFNGPTAMMQALECGACDFVMPDVARIGGVSGWMQAAGVAAAKGIENVIAPHAGNQRPIVERNADRALALVPGLGRRNPRNAVAESRMERLTTPLRSQALESCGTKAKLRRLDSL